MSDFAGAKLLKKLVLGAVEMKRIVALVLVVSLVGCTSPPKLPEPSGEWVPVNHPNSVGSNT